MMQHEEIADAQSDFSVRPPFVVAEFNLNRIVGEQFDDGAHLTSHQAGGWHVGQQGDDIEESDSGGHGGLENVAAREPWKVFAVPEDPSASNDCRALRAPHREV